MPRGDYQVEDVEASKQPSQDNSYKMCIITIFIFLVICIILLLCTLPFQSNEPVSTDEYRADTSKDTHEISEDDPEPITTKRTTLAKYQERTKASDQLPTSVTPLYQETGSTKDDKSSTASKLTTSKATPEQMPNKADDEDIAEKSNTSVLQNRTMSSTPELEDDKEQNFTTPTFVDDKHNGMTSAVGKTDIMESITPQVEDKEHVQPHENEDEYNGTTSAEEKNNKTEEAINHEANKTADDYDVTVSTVPGYQNSTTNEHSSFVKHTDVLEEEAAGTTDGFAKYNEKENHTTFSEDEIEDNSTISAEKMNNQTIERNSEANKTADDDDVTVSTVPGYQNSTTNEHSSFVKHTDVLEEVTARTTDGYAKYNEKENQTTFSEDEIEDNSTSISDEKMNNQTIERNFEDDKPIIEQTTTTTTALYQVTNKNDESSTLNTDLSNQNQTHNENVSLVEESYTHKEEKMAVTDGYSKQDEVEHQLTSPVPNINSTEDETTGQENSTQITSEVQNYAHKQSGEKQNSDTKNAIHMTATTENEMVEEITEDALNSTNIKRSLQMSVSTDTATCFLPNITSNATNDSICLSSKCKSQAKHLMKTMSFSVDACEDFYEFACGDLRINKYLQPENLEQNIWDRIHSSMEKDNSIAGEKFKSFYNQCLNYDSIPKEERINQAIEILHTVGTFYNNTSWKANPSNFTQLFLNMLQLHSAPLFDVLLDVDNTKGTRFDFQIIPPLSHSLFQDVAETELQCREDILHAYRNKKTFLLNTAYQDYKNCTLHPGDLLQKITEALEKLSAFESLDEEENTSLVRLRQAIEFSILPCKNSLPNKREMLQKLLTKDFHSTTVKDLNLHYPLIKWDILLKGLLGKEVPENLIVQLYFKDYFDELFQNVETVEMYELHNAVLALFAHDLYFNLVETKGACSRPSYCLKIASTLMQDVSSYLYLSSFTNNEIQNFSIELQEISKKIKTALKHIVEEDEDMFTTAAVKLDQMEIITDGGMNVFGATDYMESLLNDIEIDDADGYLINAVKLTKRYRKKMYQLFFKNPRNSESIWSYFVLPYNFQPVAIYPLNTVVVPYGYLGALQSYDSLMGYMKEIRLAIPLAQHIIHHFDTTGKTFNITSSKYEDIEYCLDLSYASQRSWKHPETKQIMDFKVDAPLFHNQRFTDFLALRTVLEAYKGEINSEKVLPWLGLNQEQIYFLIFAQSLCTKSDLLEDVISLFEDEYLPPTLRVADIMSNSEEFGTTYHCGVGIAMNPENKCKIFSPEELAVYVGSYEEITKQ